MFSLCLLLIIILPPALVLTHGSGSSPINNAIRKPGKRNALSIRFKASEHHNAGPVVDPAFPAFALEERSLLFYAGRSGKPNIFSRNLLDQVADRTGTQPIVRVGGTSLDQSTYRSSLSKAVRYPPGQKSENVPKNLTFGPSYFDSFANWPHARYVFTVPLAHDNLNNTLAFTQAGYAVITQKANLLAIGIGNEPDIYAGKFRPSSYGPANWASQFINYTSAISSALGLPLDTPLYDAEALSTRGDYNELHFWTQPNIFHGGLDQVEPRIKSVSLHYYQTRAVFGSSDLQRDLMNHTAIVQRCSLLLVPAIRFMKKKNIPLVVGEAGSALNLQEQGVYLFEGVLGAALWQVDFMLHCMTLGVRRINMQQGIGFTFAMWQPTRFNGTQAHVRAPYYAQLFVADFIGRAATEKAFRAAPVALDGCNDLCSAYIGFQNGRPVRLAILNLEEWNPSMSRKRPRTEFAVNVHKSVKRVQIRKLTSPVGATAVAKNMTWTGMRWTFENKGLGERVPGTRRVTYVEVKNGVAQVTVRASEAIMVSI